MTAPRLVKRILAIDGGSLRVFMRRSVCLAMLLTAARLPLCNANLAA
jgi:hypothetical protein